jgi:integron integrase
MLIRFREYLQRGGTVKEKSIPYYCRWVGNAYNHCRVDLAQPLTTDQKSDFLADMAKSHEEWQVKQARLALRPVVMTPAEVQAVLSRLSGAHRLMAQLIYGAGLRLAECLNLRIKDLDFEQNLLMVRGKGDKDRRTVLPESLQLELTAHIAGIRSLHEADRADNLPGVALGGALERKYPSAGKEWRWFWLFPAAGLSVDPRSRLVRRHHVHPSALKRAFKNAVTATEITRRASVHTLRHSFATHLLEKGHDIRTIQELLGHNDVRTTMIYTHVAKKNILGVLSPLEQLP